MKGFLFSIEAIISIILLFSVLLVIGTYTTDTSQINDYLIVKTQNSQANTFYFNENNTIVDNNTLFCETIAYYNGIKISTRQVCE